MSLSVKLSAVNPVVMVIRTGPDISFAEVHGVSASISSAMYITRLITAIHPSSLWNDLNLRFGIGLVEFHQIQNVILTAQEYRASLVDVLGDEVENALRPSGRNTARLITRSSRCVTNDRGSRPHTCSVRNAIGNASYSMRSLPDLLFLSSG